MKSNRINNRLFCAAAMCAVTTLGLSPSANADIYRVDGTLGTTSGDGSDWGEDAFLYLQDALDAADGLGVGGDQIWVAAGTYYVDRDNANHPNGSGDREATFLLKKGVILRGGFDGDEVILADRPLTGNETFLSGELDRPATGCGIGGGTDTVCCALLCAEDPYCCNTAGGWDDLCAAFVQERCGEAYHVVTASDTDIDDHEETFIERFTIQDGTANGTGTDESEGGGMLIKGNVGVVQCTFTKNLAYEINSERGKGFAMAIIGVEIRPVLVNCIFYNNPGTTTLLDEDGAGIFNDAGNPLIINCLFYDNIASGDGGAIYNEIGTGIPEPDQGVIDLINCTFADNIASNGNSLYQGGGVHNNGGAFVNAENCIFYFNEDKNGSVTSSQIFDVPSNSNVNYSDVQGTWSGGTGNIASDPLFIEANTGNYRLDTDSPCIDEGDDTKVECDIYDINGDGETCVSGTVGDNPDLDLLDRISGTVDMGSYEFESCVWDLDGDCVVDLTDLLLLLNQWGDDPGGPPDFNDDGDVDFSDLDELVTNWGLCYCAPSGTTVTSLEDELGDTCLTTGDWDDFMDKMENGTAAEMENYLCWLLHYFEDCTKCFCTGASGCPDSDPYGP